MTYMILQKLDFVFQLIYLNYLFECIVCMCST